MLVESSKHGTYHLAEVLLLGGVSAAERNDSANGLPRAAGLAFKDEACTAQVEESRGVARILDGVKTGLEEELVELLVRHKLD
jgi:hypothetical protein